MLLELFCLIMVGVKFSVLMKCVIFLFVKVLVVIWLIVCGVLISGILLWYGWKCFFILMCLSLLWVFWREFLLFCVVVFIDNVIKENINGVLRLSISKVLCVFGRFCRGCECYVILFFLVRKVSK